MAALSIELPVEKNQTAFNLRRWAELLGDSRLARDLARYEGRIETDRYGHIVMLPPADFSHGSYQSEIAHLLRPLLPEGRVVTECPISTANGVRAADAAWISRTRLATIGENVCLTKAPEICVEVISPDNSRAELAEKKALYFAASAKEVWFCGLDGRMTFYVGAASRAHKSSKLSPDFPREIRLA
jgi:Uma2 family endonuclease